MLCILINHFFHLKMGYFGPVITFLVLTLTSGMAFIEGSRALIGTVLSGLVAIFFTYFLADHMVIYVAIMSVIVFLVIALLIRYFVAMLISGVAVTIVIYNTIYGSFGHALSVIEAFTIQLFIAVVICSLLDGLIWRQKSRTSYQVTLKTVYEEFAELFGSYTSQLATERKNHFQLSTTLTTFSTLVTYINAMQREEGVKYFPIDQYLKIIAISRGIFLNTEVLEEFLSKEHKFMMDQEVASHIDQIMTLISDSFSILAESVGTKNVVNIQDKKLQDSLSSLHELYREMHELKGKDDEYYEDLLAFGAMLPVLDDITDNLKRITISVNLFHTDQYKKMLDSRVTRNSEVENIRRWSFYKINKQSAIMGIKTVIIFLILVFGEEIVGLPGKGQVIFFAIVFGVIPNLGQAYMKSKYGIIGVASGVVLSLITLYVLVLAPNFLILLLLYCIGTFLTAYIASSSKDISAAGLQAGLLFPFGILLTGSVHIDLSEGYTRALALLSAILVGLMVQHLLWPVNPYKVLKQKISNALNITAQIVSKLLILNIRDKEKVDKLVLPIAATLPTSTALLHDAEYVMRHDQLHGEELVRIIESIELIYSDLETLKNAIYDNIDSDILHIYLERMEPYYKQMNKILEQVSSQFSTRDEYLDNIAAIKLEIQNHRTELRNSGIWRKYTPEDVEQLVLITTSIDTLLDSFTNISSAISEINRKKKLGSKSLIIAREA